MTAFIEVPKAMQVDAPTIYSDLHQLARSGEIERQRFLQFHRDLVTPVLYSQHSREQATSLRLQKSYAEQRGRRLVQAAKEKMMAPNTAWKDTA